jgi:hypothetical protein
MVIDGALLGERNMIKKDIKNVFIYEGFTIEIQRMWNIKSRVIPEIFGATGTGDHFKISKKIREHLYQETMNVGNY